MNTNTFLVNTYDFAHTKELQTAEPVPQCSIQMY